MTQPKNKRKPTNQLRIIGGQWRGRKLSFPDVQHLRPTGDRIRETLFNWLQTEIIGAHCLDLFAGSGALGFEALSRGASQVLFVENSSKAVQQLKDNCRLLSCSELQIIQDDALRLLNTRPASKFNVVFLDPPFQFAILPKIIKLLTENGWLETGAKIYMEMDADSDAVEIPENWSLLKDKVTGQVKYQLFEYLG